MFKIIDDLGHGAYRAVDSSGVICSLTRKDFKLIKCTNRRSMVGAIVQLLA